MLSCREAVSGAMSLRSDSQPNNVGEFVVVY